MTRLNEWTKNIIRELLSPDPSASEPEPHFFFSPQKVFLFALFSGIVISFLSFFFIQDIFRDCANVYAYYSRELAHDGIAAGWVGRVPMLFILLSGGLAKTGIDAYSATILVASAFYVCTIFPLRRFLERYLSPFWAAWGCVLFIYAPKVIRFSVTGLLDPLRIFFLIAALLFLFRLVDHGKMRDALLLGGALGLLSVSRGEGFPIAVCLLFGVPVLMVLKKSVFPLFRKGLVFLVTAVFFFLTLFPFCLGNRIHYHAFVPDVRVMFIRQAHTIQPFEEIIARAAAESRLDAVLNALNNTLRGAYEVYLILAVIGMFLLLFRKKWNWEHTVFLGLYLAHTFMYMKISAAYRYSIYLVPLFMPFTMTGVSFARKLFCLLTENFPSGPRKLIHAACLCGLCMFFLFQAKNGLDFSFSRKKSLWENRAAAAFLRQAAMTAGIKGRARLAAPGHVEIMYWSGMEAVLNYQSAAPEPDLAVYRDYDFLLLGKEKKIQNGKCPWLEKLSLPAEIADKYQIYKVNRE